MSNNQKIKLLERQKVLGEDLLIIQEKLEGGTIRQVQFEETQKRVESKWNEFQENHNKLVIGGYKNEQYFEVNYYAQVNEYVRAINRQINSSQLLEEASTEAAIEQKKKICESSNVESGSLEGAAQLVQQETTIQFINNRIRNSGRNSWFNREISNLMDRLKEAISEIQDQSKSVLEVVKMELNEKYNKLNAKLENLGDEDEGAFSDKFSEMSNLYYKVLRKIGEKEDIDEIPTTLQPATRLQEVKIPYFEGDPKEWSSFYDMFTTLVHGNKHISKVEKMYRLKTTLRGDAAKHIQHLNITEYNYEVALEMLKVRYENRRLLFSTLVDKLLDQPNMNSDVAATIRQLLDTTNECLRSIEALGIEIEDAKPFVARIIIRKFDNEAMRQYEFNTKKTRQIQTLEDVLTFLEQMSQAQESLKGKKIASYQQKFAANNQQKVASNYQHKSVAKQSSNLTMELICVF